MFADCDSMEFEIALAFHNGNQGKVSGAATNIDDQDNVAQPDFLAPSSLACLNPVVQRGLRFFQ